MGKSKYQEHRELIKEISNIWNDLPIEERMNNRLFTGQEKLLTIWQVIEMCKEDMTPRCKRKLIEWATNIAKTTKEDLRLYKMAHSKPIDILEEIDKIDRKVGDDNVR